MTVVIPDLDAFSTVVGGPVPCTSQARHACTREATYACHGDGVTVTWCPVRHALWVDDVVDGVRCRDCGQLQAHWTVVTL